MLSLLKYLVVPRQKIIAAQRKLGRLLFWLQVILDFIKVLFRGKPFRVHSCMITPLYTIDGCPAAFSWEIRNAYLMHLSGGAGYMRGSCKGIEISHAKSDKYFLTVYGLQGKRQFEMHLSSKEVAINYNPRATMRDRHHPPPELVTQLNSLLDARQYVPSVTPNPQAIIVNNFIVEIRADKLFASLQYNAFSPLE